MTKLKETLKLSTEMAIPMTEAGKITKNTEEEDTNSKRDRKSMKESGTMTQRKDNLLKPEIKMGSSSRATISTMRKMVSSPSLILKQGKSPGRKNGKTASSRIKNDHAQIYSHI